MSLIQDLADAVVASGGRSVRAGDGFRVTCPAHLGGDTNCSIRPGKLGDGGVSIRCHSHGCKAAQILAGLGYRYADVDGRLSIIKEDEARNLKYAAPSISDPAHPDYVREEPIRSWEWIVRDLDGNKVAVKTRNDYKTGPKRYGWFTITATGGRQYGLKNGLSPRNLPLYGSHLLKGYKKGSRVLVVEGEKDCDFALGINVPCVAWVGGAATIPDKEVLECLRGFIPVIYADNDEAGFKAANKLSARLASMKIPHEVVNPEALTPGIAGGGFADWREINPGRLSPNEQRLFFLDKLLPRVTSAVQSLDYTGNRGYDKQLARVVPRRVSLEEAEKEIRGILDDTIGRMAAEQDLRPTQRKTGIVVLATTTGTGKTHHAVRSLAKTLDAFPGVRATFASPTHAKTKESRRRLEGLTRRKFSGPFEKDENGNRVCVAKEEHVKSAVASGLTAKQICLSCPFLSTCAVGKGVEDDECSWTFCTHAGLTPVAADIGVLVIDEMPALTADKETTLFALRYAAQGHGKIHHRHAATLRKAAEDMLGWVMDGARGEPRLDTEEIKRAGMVAVETNGKKSQRFIAHPPEQVSLHPTSHAYATLLSKEDRLAREALAWVMSYAGGKPRSVQAKGDKLTARYRSPAVESIASARGALILDATMTENQREALETMTGLKVKVVRVEVEDAAEAERIWHPTSNASRTTLFSRGLNAKEWIGQLRQAAKDILAWRKKTGNAPRVLVSTYKRVADLLRDPSRELTVHEGEIVGAWRKFVEWTENAGGTVAVAHFGNVRGYNCFDDCNVSVEIGDAFGEFEGTNYDAAVDDAAAESAQVHGRLRSVRRNEPLLFVKCGRVLPAGWEGRTTTAYRAPGREKSNDNHGRINTVESKGQELYNHLPCVDSSPRKERTRVKERVKLGHDGEPVVETLDYLAWSSQFEGAPVADEPHYCEDYGAESTDYGESWTH